MSLGGFAQSSRRFGTQTRPSLLIQSGPEKDLEMPEEIPDDKQDHYNLRSRHDHLSADG